jgi:hypothetical protein
MAFITHCWRKRQLEGLRCFFASLIVAFSGFAFAQPTGVEVSEFKLERSAEALQLSAFLSFELTPTVEEALLKGVPVFFVAEAEIFQDRWYWADKKVTRVERHMRLAYHPLTRRWRLSVAAGPIVNNGLGVALNQVFDSLQDALSAVRRVPGWQIVAMGELVPDAKHRIEFKFRLDVSQLPRPLQIGVLGQNEWALSASHSQRFVPESLR